jgi:hypothetical protein
MVDRHYSLNLKPWSARTLYVYAHVDLARARSREKIWPANLKFLVGEINFSLPFLLIDCQNGDVS